MMMYETATDAVVVDCGVLFPSADEPGVDRIIPDISYVLRQRHKLRAFILTHAHEDHIGALPLVLRHLGEHAEAPIFATAFTLAMLRAKFAEYPQCTPDLRQIEDGLPFVVAGLTVTPLAVTHSIPGCVALALETPVGVVVHTGDFKLDPRPLDGRLTDEGGLRRLGDAGVAVLLSDSTNALREGCSESEQVVRETLFDLIAQAPERVVVSTFASNIHRLQSIVDASIRCGRVVFPLGRSLQRNIRLALDVGALRAPFGGIADTRDTSDLGHRARREVTIVASGCQGEPRSAMSCLAVGDFPGVTVDAGDRVILSSRRIPGNERAVGTLVNNFLRRGMQVIEDGRACVHTSGHGFQGEMRRMLELCRPSAFVPLHGELRHMLAHAALAREAGVSPENVFVVEDGTSLVFVREGATLRGSYGEPVRAGLVFVAGTGAGGVGAGEVGQDVLRERRVLAQGGVVFCALRVSSDAGGRVAITGCGLAHEDDGKGSTPLREAHLLAEKALHEAHHDDVEGQRLAVQTTLTRYFRQNNSRQPLVIVVWV